MPLLIFTLSILHYPFSIASAQIRTNQLADYTKFLAVFDGSFGYCPDAGSNDTYVCSRTVALTAYVTGSWIDLKPNTINTGAATVNVNSLGAKTIVQHDGNALTDGLLQAGRSYRLTYDGTNFRMQAGGTGSGTITGSGTSGKIAKFTGSSAIGDSGFADDGAGNFSWGDVSSHHYAWSFTTPTATRTIRVPDQANIQLGPFGVYWDAAALTPDGTNCADGTKQTLNSGPTGYFFSCADSNSSIIYFQTVLPVAITTATFKLTLFHGTTESITFAGDFSAQCRAAGTAPNSTWGTAVAADVAITTANQIAEATSAAVTPNGTCSAGSTLFGRYVVDAANFSANSANAKVVSVYMEKAS